METQHELLVARHVPVKHIISSLRPGLPKSRLRDGIGKETVSVQNFIDSPDSLLASLAFRNQPGRMMLITVAASGEPRPDSIYPFILFINPGVFSPRSNKYVR